MGSERWGGKAGEEYRLEHLSRNSGIREERSTLEVHTRNEKELRIVV